MKIINALFFILLLGSDAVAQKQTLTGEQIFHLQRSHNPVEIVKWIDDDSFITQKREKDKISFSLVKIKTKEQINLNENETAQYLPKALKKLESGNGDIIYEGETLAQGNNRNQELSPDGNYIAYTRDNDLYTMRLADKKEFRLTHDGSDVILNGYASWVYMEEILGRSSHYKAFWWSPDSKTIAFFRTDDSKTPTFIITDSPGQHGYFETMRYPKSGDPNPEIKTGFVNPEGTKTVWADFNQTDDQYFGKPCWTPSGRSIWMQWMNRGQDNYKIFDVNINTGEKTEIYNETQKAWIDIDKGNIINFLSDGRAIIINDKSGYFHLYLHANDGSPINPITRGDFTVLDIIKIDEKNRTVYFTCYKDNVACTDFYAASFDGKKLQRLSFGNYTHRISLSPNARYFVSSYSNVNTPVKVGLYNTKGKLIMDLDDSRNEQNEVYDWPATELITVKSKDNKYDLPMRVTLPVKMEKDKKYPVLIDVYGGPAAITVRQGWFGNSKLLNWYSYEGLIQVSLDHRGSLHFGKKGQEEMHRNLGAVEVSDYAACVKWLIENAQADPERICINGFSYGGYITCFALAYAPDVFTHGIAGGSVTDWMLYDAPYTERYMDHPKENPEGYRQSSVMTHAEKLKGKLLLTHGLLDENVHAQNTFQLVSALEDMNKDFDLVIYPSSRHGYGGAKSLHFRNLQIRFIYEYLLRKPVPDVLKQS
ncbi:MAG: S9 family peptidase [Prevotella sp.]|jgi:dipeptidyl-peptidase-4|nr:S9 family peptidase [Prevotella sp.]